MAKTSRTRSDSGLPGSTLRRARRRASAAVHAKRSEIRSASAMPARIGSRSHQAPAANTSDPMPRKATCARGNLPSRRVSTMRPPSNGEMGSRFR